LVTILGIFEDVGYGLGNLVGEKHLFYIVEGCFNNLFDRKLLEIRHLGKTAMLWYHRLVHI